MILFSSINYTYYTYAPNGHKLDKSDLLIVLLSENQDFVVCNVIVYLVVTAVYIFRKPAILRLPCMVAGFAHTWLVDVLDSVAQRPQTVNGSLYHELLARARRVDVEGKGAALRIDEHYMVEIDDILPSHLGKHSVELWRERLHDQSRYLCTLKTDGFQFVAVYELDVAVVAVSLHIEHIARIKVVGFKLVAYRQHPVFLSHNLIYHYPIMVHSTIGDYRLLVQK